MARIFGYAVMFNTPSRLLSFPSELRKFREVILQGSFSEMLRSGSDIKLLCSHDRSKILASTLAKTLKLEETATGLRFSADVDLDQTYASDLYISIQRGDTQGMSYSITVPSGFDRWEHQDDGTYIRYVSRVYTDEISTTGFPATEETICEVSSRTDAQKLHASNGKVTIAGVPLSVRQRQMTILKLQSEILEYRKGKNVS